MKVKMILLGLAVFVTTGVGYSAVSEPVLGIWKTEAEKSHVEIFKSGGKLCGKIVWLKEPAYTDSKEGPVGAAKTDTNNPDPARRARPIVGLQIMEGFSAAEGDRWENGTIYDPESGKTYRCKMKLTAPGRLEVRGFVGVSLFGRTTVWTR